MSFATKSQLIRAMFDAAIAAAQPHQFMPDAVRTLLPDTIKGRLFVTGFGKASAAMAQVLEAEMPNELAQKIYGKIIIPDGHEETLSRLELMHASHPVPDARSAAAAAYVLEEAGRLGADDIMLVLISGGGSSLMCLPRAPLTLSEKQDVTQQLLKKGAPIGAMNCLRKHLSAVKGGQLAVAAYPARTISFAISDVPGDEASVIASGPTVADETSRHDALAVIKQYGLDVPAAVLAVLDSAVCETPFSDDAALSASNFHLLATPQRSLEAAADIAQHAGYEPVILGDALEGNSRDLAAEQAQLAIEMGPGKALISGGETTVMVTGTGSGGRNAEFAHALALEGRFDALAADTDGIDGAAAIAGAIISPDTVERAAAAGLDAYAMLQNNDSHSFFAALGDQIITGPTRTNVNDFRVILTG
jgi:hydroxypyruvate reductase